MDSKKLAFGHFWCVDEPQHIGQAGGDEPILYCRNAPRIFRMPYARVVFADIQSD